MPDHALLIHRWAVTSAYGVGREPFSAAVCAERPAARSRPASALQGDPPEVVVLPEQSPARLLQGKGTRAMDRVTALSLLTLRELLSADDSWKPGSEHDDTGLVLGTKGSYESMATLSRSTLTEAKPFFLDVARIPNAVMNCAASRCAIWHGITGPNATIASGRVAGLAALAYARRLLLAGHATSILWGGADEHSPSRSWIERPEAAGAGNVGPLGEGCALFDLSLGSTPPPSGAVGAEILAIRTRMLAGPADRSGMAVCLQETADRAGVGHEPVWVASASGPRHGDEVAALNASLGSEAVSRAGVADLLGDTGAASGALQLAAVLAWAQEDPAADGRLAVVTSVDDTGAMACAFVRLRAGVPVEA